jgi:putative acetyltransferase
MKIAPLNPAVPAAQALIGQLDALRLALYPPESTHLDSVEVLQLPNVLFLGAWFDELIVGCGAVKTLSDDGLYGEVKRLFVAEPDRGSPRRLACTGASATWNGVRSASMPAIP